MGKFKQMDISFKEAEDIFEDWYGDYMSKIPRFEVEGMNQAEFIHHMQRYFFQRGVQYGIKDSSEVLKKTFEKTVGNTI